MNANIIRSSLSPSRLWGLIRHASWGAGLAGPIFEKELRVSSRRKRNYILRSAYVVILTAFVVMVWSVVASPAATAGYRNATLQQSLMAEVGKDIVTTIVLFQFIATQAIAVIMLATAISDEIYHQTLGLLMTTPITSVQVVMGKVLSKLLQLLLLVAITLPLLAIVRVFGGVPWNYLLSSFCVTLTAGLFAASVSLFFSIGNRRAYVVIIKSLFALGTLYTILPTVITILFGGFYAGVLSFVGPPNPVGRGSPLSVVALFYLNPFQVMYFNTTSMLAPGPGRLSSFAYWPLHCVVMLLLTAGVLAAACVIVRRVALRQAMGQTWTAPQSSTRRNRRPAGLNQPDGSEYDPSFVQRVPSKAGQDVGRAVLWRELRAPTIQGLDSTNSYIGLAATILGLLITYALAAANRCLDENFSHMSYGLLFVLLGIVFNIVFSSTRITSEKESSTWPILLSTPLDDWDILMGKAISTFRRCLPIWLLLAGHILLFVLIGYIHPIVILHMFLVVLWLTIFMIGSGLYFSARCRRTTAAVVANFALVLALWVVAPVVIGIVAERTHGHAAATALLLTHPGTQTASIMMGASGAENAHRDTFDLEFAIVGESNISVGQFSLMLSLITLAYSLVGLLFLWAAKRRLRRNVF